MQVRACITRNIKAITAIYAHVLTQKQKPCPHELQSDSDTPRHMGVALQNYLTRKNYKMLRVSKRLTLRTFN
jgi:hypothetical protein